MRSHMRSLFYALVKKGANGTRAFALLSSRRESLYIGDGVHHRVGLPRFAIPWSGIGAVMPVRFQRAGLINENHVADVLGARARR